MQLHSSTTAGILARLEQVACRRENGCTEALVANAPTAYIGPAGGSVLTVSKGLVVYLLGDVGTIADQEMVARRFYKPKPAVLNIGGMFSAGPAEAAYVINDLIKPNAVIASHASQATTKNGKLLVGSRVMVFRTAVKVPTYLPVSSKSMSITADGKCVAGC